MNQKLITTREFIKTQFERDYLQDNSDFVIQTRKNVLMGTLILYYTNNIIMYHKIRKGSVKISSRTHKSIVINYYYDKRRAQEN